MMHRNTFLPAILALTLGAADLPQTAKRPVIDTYHGIRVVDHYRWLEDLQSPETAGWLAAQNAFGRAFLDKLDWRPRMVARVEELTGGDSAVTYAPTEWAAGRFFGRRQDPKLQYPQLIAFHDPQRPEDARIIVDPNAPGEQAGRLIDWYKPSPDGRYIAVSMSNRGSESGDVYTFEVATGNRIDIVIPAVQRPTAGGDLAWTPQSEGFYYTRYPRSGERPEADSRFYQQLWFHKLGTNLEQDRYELGRDFPRIAEIRVEVHSSGTVLALVQNGDGGEFFHYVKPGGSSEWKRLTNYSDRVVQMDFTADANLIAISRLKAPRGKLLLLKKPDYSLGSAQIVVPEGKDNIVNNHYGIRTIVAGKDRLYVTFQTGGPSEIRAYSYKGAVLPGPQIAPVSSVGPLTPVGENDVLYYSGSYFTPTKGSIFRAATGRAEQTEFGARVTADFSAFEAVREFARSKDGTEVPISLLRRKGLKLDGSHPVVVTGYGGYGLSMQPFYSPSLKALLDEGVVYAIANLRGGGEFGEEWHNRGRLTRKQNVFDDFEAALHHLIERRYTSSSRLGVIGGSNGGLLVGALITQHPDLVRAAVIKVGVLDMLRKEQSPNGVFNTVEYGTVKEKQHFDVLYSYSPYHRVREDTKYPAVLLTTGMNDGRVDPMHSLKFTARLQSASSFGRPVVLQVDADAGHGGGTRRSTRISQLADDFAFFLHELGVPVKSRP